MDKNVIKMLNNVEPLATMTRSIWRSSAPFHFTTLNEKHYNKYIGICVYLNVFVLENFI